MTPLDAMRRLAAHGLRDAHRGVCAVCEQWWTREDPGFSHEIVHHLPDCPVPHLAGVVAVLEAAEALVGECRRAGRNHGPELVNRAMGIESCTHYCSTWPCDVGMLEAPTEALDAALKGGA